MGLKENIFGLKTTLLGVLLILIATIYLFYCIDSGIDYNKFTFGGLIAAGVILILSPDKILASVDKILDKFLK
jgi:hypothetical protein